nr:putative polyketide hydroxylase isoform X1 [Ipomoea batatas]
MFYACLRCTILERHGPIGLPSFTGTCREKKLTESLPCPYKNHFSVLQTQAHSTKSIIELAFNKRRRSNLALHQVLNNTVGSILPSGVQKTILDGIFSIGRAHLSDLVLNPNNPLGSARLARLREIFEEGQSLQLQFPAEDLGFRYLKGALVSDGDNLLHEPEAPTGRRRDFVPSADPGSRLPHINIRPFSNPPSKETFSTLDLVSAEKLEFLLIIAPVDSSYHLALATFQVAEECKVPLKVCVMWPGETNAGANRSKAALLPWENFVDVLEVKRPPNSSSWWGACQMTDRGAILVRPDEHIAWRTKSELAGDATTEMRKVFHTILGSQY